MLLERVSLGVAVVLVLLIGLQLQSSSTSIAPLRTGFVTADAIVKCPVLEPSILCNGSANDDDRDLSIANQGARSGCIIEYTRCVAQVSTSEQAAQASCPAPGCFFSSSPYDSPCAPNVVLYNDGVNLCEYAGKDLDSATGQLRSGARGSCRPVPNGVLIPLGEWRVLYSFSTGVAGVSCSTGSGIH